ncbi:hypothetical protein D3C81_661630 [compost metagenome]
MSLRRAISWSFSERRMASSNARQPLRVINRVSNSTKAKARVSFSLTLMLPSIRFTGPNMGVSSN